MTLRQTVPAQQLGDAVAAGDVLKPVPDPGSSGVRMELQPAVLSTVRSRKCPRLGALTLQGRYMPATGTRRNLMSSIA